MAVERQTLPATRWAHAGVIQVHGVAVVGAVAVSAEPLVRLVTLEVRAAPAVRVVVDQLNSAELGARVVGADGGSIGGRLAGGVLYGIAAVTAATVRWEDFDVTSVDSAGGTIFGVTFQTGEHLWLLQTAQASSKSDTSYTDICHALCVGYSSTLCTRSNRFRIRCTLGILCRVTESTHTWPGYLIEGVAVVAFPAQHK